MMEPPLPSRKYQTLDGNFDMETFWGRPHSHGHEQKLRIQGYAIESVALPPKSTMWIRILGLTVSQNFMDIYYIFLKGVL